MTRRLSHTTLMLALAMFAADATAHGEAIHEKPTASVVKEQKPWGIGAEKSAAKRSITIRMSDAMRFNPDTIRVKRGETVRFVIHNDGRMLHEMVIGTQATLDEHAALMQKFPDMEHDEPYMTHVAPGKTGEIVWHFNRTGEFGFACLIPGHYQAGMKGRIVVSP